MIQRRQVQSRDNTPACTVKNAGESARRLSASKSYAGYLFRSMHASDVYRRVRRALLWLSRIRILSTAMRILSLAVAIIEAGTHVFVVSTLFLILLPISAVIASVTLILSAIGQRHASRRLSAVTEGGSVYVLFPDRTRSLSDGFIHRLASSLADDEDAAVFIVSPFFWSGTGFGGKKYYLHYRRDGENVFMLRKYYYFSFRRSVLNEKKENGVTLIY